MFCTNYASPLELKGVTKMGNTLFQFQGDELNSWSTTYSFNPLSAKLFNLNFHPLEVDAIHNLFRFDTMEVNSFQILLVYVTFYL